MKKLFALLFSLSCLFSLAACGADKGETHGAEGSSKDWGITMTAEKVTSSGLTLIITQSGGIAEGSLETGSEYSIQKMENNNWVEVKPQGEAVWDMMSHLIASDADTEFTIDWSWLYGELSPGTYRICKTVVDFKGPGVSESQFYCAEFEIKG